MDEGGVEDEHLTFLPVLLLQLSLANLSKVPDAMLEAEYSAESQGQRPISGSRSYEAWSEQVLLADGDGALALLELQGLANQGISALQGFRLA